MENSIENKEMIKDKEEKASLKDIINSLKAEEKRNFKQSFDLIINLKNIDVKKENVVIEIELPNGRGKDISIGVISDDVKDALGTKELNELAQDPKKARKYAKQYNFFLCSAPLMPTVGKILGRYLAPIGKMPKPIPPKVDVTPFIEMSKKTVRMRATKFSSLKCIVGTEDMDADDIEKNIKYIISVVEKKLPKGRNQIKNILLKLTMGKPVKITF